MNYGYSDKEWEDIKNGKWNERYFDVAKRHIEVENIHYPHLFYLLRLADNQQKEIKQLHKRYEELMERVEVIQNVVGFKL